MHTENFTIHHDFPGIDGKVGIIEAPVKLLASNWLIRGVVIRRNIFVVQRLSCVYSFSGIKYKHFFQKIKSLQQYDLKYDLKVKNELRTIGICGAKFLTEWNAFAFG